MKGQVKTRGLSVKCSQNCLKQAPHLSYSWQSTVSGPSSFFFSSSFLARKVLSWKTLLEHGAKALTSGDLAQAGWAPSLFPPPFHQASQLHLASNAWICPTWRWMPWWFSHLSTSRLSFEPSPQCCSLPWDGIGEVQRRAEKVIERQKWFWEDRQENLEYMQCLGRRGKLSTIISTKEGKDVSKEAIKVRLINQSQTS